MRPDEFAVGQVWHRRYRPALHAFRYRLWFSLLDVDRIEEHFRRSRWWSIEKRNLVSFRRRDFLAPFESGLADAVRGRVETELGRRPQGPVRMLTHIRQWGLCFNPVTLYFCELEGEGGLDAIVAEVHNTPWNERHAYVLDARDQPGPDYRFEFDKRFHVSPFLSMKVAYDWRFGYRGDEIRVHMKVMDEGTECFAAGMNLARQPLTTRAMALLPLKFPAIAVKVMAGIYYQALRLWLKRTPVFEHPDSASKKDRNSG
ncbi:MAG: DUF1365 domain-containing protein [Wenzhouxiangellaceae bacterium]|nr:DUF1365 domain-containing protein [Wenzhouxiangellaceae bacterium]